MERTVILPIQFKGEDQLKIYRAIREESYLSEKPMAEIIREALKKAFKVK